MDRKKYLVIKNLVKVFFFSMIVAGMMSPANAVLKAKWRTSTSAAPWVAEQQLSIVTHTTQATEIVLDTTTKYQTMTGWGGSPNESGVLGLHKLSATLQDSVVKALFDTVTGCKFNMIRLPIGCSDFSDSGYSLDDFNGDYTMSKINIHRDSLVSLDFCMKALAHNANLKVWGSPWTAPAWMKNNNKWAGGTALSEECALKQDSATLKAYALYFSKAVTMYKNYGIPFFAIAFQNEPYCCQSFPSMRWSSGAMMLNFMKNYLGPRVKADHPEIELWTPTMNLSDTAFFVPMLRDAYCSSIITTVCYQYQGEDAMPLIHKKFPNLRAYNTELACGGGDNSWSYPQTQTFPEIKRGVSNGNSGAFQWNLLLCNVPNVSYDKLCGYSGMWQNADGSKGNWPQQPLITIDTAAKKIAYNTEFYMLKHLSYYIRPGSQVIKVLGQYDTNEISVKNPDGSLVVVTNNQNNAPQNIAICFGTQMIQASLPALSYASFKIYDSTGTSVSGVPGTLAMPYVAAIGSFKVTGDRFTLSPAYEGMTNVCKVYDMHGRLVKEFSVRSRDINLSKDFGISQGAYVVHVKAIANQSLATK